MNAGIHHQGGNQAQLLTDDKLPAPHRPRGQNRVKRAPLDLLADQADAEKDGDHDAEQRNCRQPEVHQHQPLDAQRDASQQEEPQTIRMANTTRL